MLPTMGQIHRNRVLTQMSIGYRNQMYVADGLFPSVKVAKKADIFLKFLKGAFFRNEAMPRGPGATARRGGFHVSSDTYNCIEYAMGYPIPIEHLANADNPLDLWGTGVRWATDKVQLAKEVKARDLVFAGSAFTNEEDAEAGWLGTADGSGNTFIADILKGKNAIRSLIGVEPNVLLMDYLTFNEIKKEYTVLERIKYTGTSGKPADVTRSTLAQLFELEEVLIAGAIRSDAEEVMAGTDFNAVDLWTKNATKGSALLFFRTKAPTLWEPSTGYTFTWPAGIGGPDARISVDQLRDVRYYWENAPQQWVVEAAENFDLKITCADGGYLFTDTIVT